MTRPDAERRGPSRRSRAARPAGATRLLVALLLGALWLALPRAARAQEVGCDPGDTEVRALEFTGNHAFDDDELASAVVVTPSNPLRRYRWVRGAFGWAGLARRCIDRTQLVLDRARLVIFYRAHGYPDVQVDTAVRRDGRAIRVRFAIVEGRPIRIDTLTINWADPVPGTGRLTRGLPVRVGAAFDKSAVTAARDTLIARLGNAGYPWAQVLASYQTNTERHAASVSFDVLPGTRTRLGTIDIDVAPRSARAQQEIADDVARQLTGLRPGALYRDRDIATARRNLYLTEAYQSVTIERDSGRASTGTDSLVNLRVSLLEGYMHAARMSAGYGTIDCLRGQGDVTHRAFRAFGVSSRLELSARVSKIGVGEPLRSEGFEKAACPQLREDPYSEKLNYYGGLTLRQPVLSGVPNVLPTTTLYSLRQSEYKAFLRVVPIGTSFTKVWQSNPRLPQTVAYQIEYGSTESQPAVFCAVFNACLQSDRERLTRRLRTAALGYSITRNRANDPVNPTRGSLARIDVRHASRLIGSNPDIQFNRGQGDVSWYLPGGKGNVIGLRMRAGGVFGQRLTLTEKGIPDFVPQQERLFAGGAQTVRGFRQNELGPLVYIAGGVFVDTVETTPGEQTYYFTTTDTLISRRVPTGGNTLMLANVEYRMRSPFLPELLQWVFFMDAGNVWDRRAAKRVVRLLETPGAGIRVASPFGPIRVDVGYNRHPLARGEVYYQALDVPGRPLVCATPRNTVAYRRDPVTGGLVQVQATARCPASYTPPRGQGLRRLNISLGIAQAF